MVTKVYQKTVVDLFGQDLIGLGTGVDLEDFDDLGDMVLDVTGYVSLVETVNLYTI